MILVLLLGSNIEDRQKNLVMARNLLIQRFSTPVSESSVFVTQPWGFADDTDFINQVVVFNSDLDPHSILRIIQNIETDLGRERKSDRYDSRTIDIDILFFGDKVINSDQLTIPHPLLHLRRFTLVPLAEILPDYLHPVLGKRLDVLLKECADTLKVSIFDAPE